MAPPSPLGRGVHSPSAHTQPGAAKSVADILDAAADLIEPEGAWTQGAFARHRSGNPIGPLESNAACWCASGAIQRADSRRRFSPAWEDFNDYAVSLGFLHMAAFNDAPERTQAEVVAALRAAAEKARAAAPDSLARDEGEAGVNP